MSIDLIQELCKSLPGVTEDIKWDHDLVFSVGTKMFCVVSIDDIPLRLSFKVPDEEFERLCTREGFVPAPYLARHKWVMVGDASYVSKKELNFFIRQSYDLVKNKLSSRVKSQLGLN